MKKLFILVLFLSFLFWGCNAYTPTKEVLNPTIQNTSTIILLPSPKPTEIVKQTDTALAQLPLFTKHCLNISNSFLHDDSLTGTLLLVSPTLSENYFLDMKTGEKHPLSQDKEYLANNFTASPNGDWLAYIGAERSSQGASLVVQANDGHQTYRYPINYDEWQIIAYWLDNDTLVLWNHAGPLDNVILFNPFTGKKETRSANYPGLISDDSGWDFSWPSATIYDSSLQYLVYLANGDNGYQFGFQKLILWDLKNARAIAKVNDFGYTWVKPLWKSDNSGVIFVKSVVGYDPPDKKDEVFFLGLDGKIKQLTKLSEFYPYAKIYSYGWSPDEHFLAFELETSFSRGQKSERKLLILNMSTLEISDYCLSPEQFTPLIWSPDSRYLAYSEMSTNDTSRTILIDLVGQKSFVIAEKLKPAGWLRSTK